MTRLRSLARLVWQLLRELADENAYDRHLKHHGRTHSRAEWQRFRDAHLRARYHRAKCC